MLVLADLNGDQGECREALLQLARELTQAPAQTLLRDLVVLIVPSPRVNADTIDWQREFAALANPDSRALVQLARIWNPDIVLEFRRPAPAAPSAIDCPPAPRFGADYFAFGQARAALAAPASDGDWSPRVAATRSMAKTLLQFAAAHKPAIRAARNDAARHGTQTPLPPLVVEPTADGAHVVRGLLASPLKTTPANSTTPIPSAPGNTPPADAASSTPAEPASPSTRPFAYLLPARANAVAETLQRHGFAVEALREDIELEVAIARYPSPTAPQPPSPANPSPPPSPPQSPVPPSPPQSPGTGTVPTAASASRSIGAPQPLTAAWRSARQRVEAGTFLVRAATPWAPLLAQLLEPDSRSGFATAKLLAPTAAADWPVWRLAGYAPLLTAASPPPVERRGKPQRVTFDLWQRAAVNLHGDAFPTCQWLDDEHYLQRRDGQLWRIHAATGRWSAFPADIQPLTQSLSQLAGIGMARAVSITRNLESRLNADHSAFLFEFANDLYYARLDGSRSVRLTATPQREELASFSPDGRSIAFVRDLNLFVVDVATGAERQLTTDGGGRVRCGKADWIYYEELFLRDWRAYWWSPDSQRLAFLRIDDGPVLDFTVIDPVPHRQLAELTPYPKAGDPLPLAQLGCVSVAGGPPVWVKLDAYPPPETLISRAGFTPDGRQVFAHVLNRQQTWLDLVVANPATGDARRLVRETTPAWVDDHGPPMFLADGGFLFLSERDGYRHLYRYAADGRLLGPVTRGPWEVRGQPWLTAPQAADAQAADAQAAASPVNTGPTSRWLHFAGTRDGWLGSQDYRLPLADGPAAPPATLAPPAAPPPVSPPATSPPATSPSAKEPRPANSGAADVAGGGPFERLTTGSGTHVTQWNRSGTLCVDRRGDLTTPARAVLIDNQGRRLRTLDNNPAAQRDAYVVGRVERLEIPAEGGFTLDGLLFYPPDFDERRKYPVWIKTYGGPHLASVRDAWEGGRVEDHAHADAGFLVLRIDPRSASGKGAVSTWTAYKRLGKQELADLEDAVRWLGRRPYVALDRVGLSGYSYGGFLTCYALTHSKLFAAGVAGAPVTDWRNYDAIYTERYLDTPRNNPEGYKAASVVAAAGQLSGKLLLAHGVMDDNVHVQNSLQLLGALQDANKFVETQFYPRARHGLPHGHFGRLSFDFMVRHLRP